MVEKTLKFSEKFIKPILSGEKFTTWRINDDKDISVDNILSLCRKDGKSFTKAKVIFIKVTTFANLTSEDKEGNGEFKSDEEMYATFRKYYSVDVNEGTQVKVIKFKVLSSC